ncbi:GntR family transcriptional regulator [Anaerococcus lactolyticus]|uniref:Transcriptional regulator, GntR family n=2 Tax=Anaerococcus lactolyticus TaxID=33032 RepID=C2BH96_9FIRM|nr:GntR family transcriptional regulator [Anaerococcus lactolyticus]EEI85739.1 transcriptional regulator, GntR family [Anaerococcus lactolyticus ATCC 51172]KGF04716.1 transcriptional regulator [Anaerococcus lactolyticus S7-1-13]
MFKLDANSETPLYMQIVEQTKVAIAAGYLQNGDKFPSVRELSKELLINQTTVSKAFKELSSQGIIKTQPGIGTVIELNSEKIDIKRDEFIDKLEEDLSQAIFLKISKEEIIELYEKVEGEIDVI